MTNKYVITGGPSVGKSTTLREISARGYQTVPEAARLFFERKKAEGYNATEAREEFDFQTEIEKIRYTIENIDYNSDCVFYDRSVYDNLAYREYYDEFHNIYPKLTRHITDGSVYDKIFILEPLDFDEDSVRDEDKKGQKEIHNKIYETYEDFDYNPVSVPVMPIQERVEYILDNSVDYTPPIH